MKASVPIPFGIDRNNFIRFAAQVPNGLACGCTCPECKRLLVAYQNFQDKTRRPHFKHQPQGGGGQEVPCTGGRETVLHKLAKAWIAGRKRLKVPACEFEPSLRDELGNLHRGEPVRVEAAELNVDSSTVEATVSEYRVDVLLKTGDYQLAVEVVVTHPVDAAKVKLLEGLGISVLEVNLSPMLAIKYLQLADIEAHLASGSAFKWHHHEPSRQRCAEAMEALRRRMLAGLQPSPRTARPANPSRSMQRGSSRSISSASAPSLAAAEFHARLMASIEANVHCNSSVALRSLLTVLGAIETAKLERHNPANRNWDEVFKNLCLTTSTRDVGTFWPPNDDLWRSVEWQLAAYRPFLSGTVAAIASDTLGNVSKPA